MTEYQCDQVKCCQHKVELQNSMLSNVLRSTGLDITLKRGKKVVISYSNYENYGNIYVHKQYNMKCHFFWSNSREVMCLQILVCKLIRSTWLTVEESSTMAGWTFSLTSAGLFLIYFYVWDI